MVAGAWRSRSDRNHRATSSGHVTRPVRVAPNIWLAHRRRPRIGSLQSGLGIVFLLTTLPGRVVFLVLFPVVPVAPRPSPPATSWRPSGTVAAMASQVLSVVPEKPKPRPQPTGAMSTPRRSRISSRYFVPSESGRPPCAIGPRRRRKRRIPSLPFRCRIDMEEASPAQRTRRPRLRQDACNSIGAAKRFQNVPLLLCRSFGGGTSVRKGCLTESYS